MVIEGRMLGNRPLRRPRSGTLDTLILQGVTYVYYMKIIIKREAMKRMVQGLQLPLAEHLRENMELSYFETSLTIFHRPW